jgi:hypothetical protein
VGAILGVLALGFMNLITYVPELWQGKEYYNDLEKVCYKCGKVWWIGMAAAIGLVIGTHNMLKIVMGTLKKNIAAQSQTYINTRLGPSTVPTKKP